MDYNLLMIIKKEKEKLENGFDNCLQNSVLSNNQQETFNYVNFKEEKQSCSICSENFINSYSLYKHNLGHLKVPLVRQEIFICVVCSNFYKTKKQLQNHITTAHKDKTLFNRTNSSKASLYKCEVCKKVLKYKTWLHHKKNCNLHHCDICRKNFKSLNRLTAHKKYSHTYQEGMNQCPKCPKILNSKSSMKLHFKNCHSEGSFQCKICKSVFESKSYLLTHMQNMHYDDGMLHHCDICGKSFKSPKRVTAHKKYSHTYLNGIYQEGMTVQCPKCPKILNSKSSLKLHFKNCHSEGTFHCKLCKSVLKSKTYLLTHMHRVHYDDGMLHRCDICGKNFKSPRYLRVHKKNSHTYLK